MVVGMGSWLEWYIVGTVVGVVMVLMVLVMMIMEASISVPAATSSPSASSSLPTRPRRCPPPLFQAPLVAATVMLFDGIVTVAVDEAVQRVTAVAVLVVLVEAALVALLPGPMRTGGPHASRRRLEWQGQESITLRRGRRRGSFTLHSVTSCLLPLLSITPSLSQTQSLQGSARGAPGQPVGRVTLERKLKLALLWGDEASGPRQVNRNNRGVLTCRREGHRK